MKRTAALAATVAVLAAAASAACGKDYVGYGSPEARAGVATVQEEVTEVEWGPCDLADMYGDAEPGTDLNPEQAAWAEALQCGSVTVPVDYEDTGGDRVAIAMVRHPASKDSAANDRTGSLLINPGGPGGSGIELAMTPFLPEDVTAAFDIVGFDPRGVGASRNLTCGSDDELDAALTEVYAEDPAAITAAQSAALENGAATLAEGCTEQIKANFLANIGTQNVARDIEVMRAALGDDELNYLGYSYGTYIGQMYLYLYPDKVRAMALDGVMRTSGSVLDLAEGQAGGFATAWRDFVAYCLTVTDCPFTSVDASGAELEAILQSAVDGELTVGEMLGMIAESLYSEAKWPALEKILAAVDAGTGREFPERLEDLAGSTGASRYLPSPLPLPHRDTEANFYGVQCVDRDNPHDFDSYQDGSEAAYGKSNLFGAGIAWSYLPCATWSANEPGPKTVSGKGSPEIVLIANEGDPATPYEWAQSVAQELDNGVLVTYEGSGHTAYALGHTCIDEPVTAYLVDLTVPATDLKCPQELD